MKALIMAGGKGTRLVEITKNVLPKPMVQLDGKPLLLHAIDSLKRNGVDEVFISVGFLYQTIIDYFGNGEKFGIKINYIIEDKPLGSGGALYYLKNKLTDDFIVCMGDALFDIDVSRMLKFHKKNNAIATLLVHPNCHPYDSDLVIVDENNKIIKIDKKGTERNYFYKNNVNAGFFIINPSALYFFDKPKVVSMENDFIKKLIEDGKKVVAYKSSEYIKDVGTPERYFAGLHDLQRGIVQKKCLRNKQKAIFFDRDGTLNKYCGFVRCPEDLVLVDDAVEALKLVNESQYLAIIISNQPVIARGECTFEEVENIFNKLESELGHKGVYVDGRYYCPHHPHKGYAGEVESLKINCNCRKPKIGLIEQAAKDFNLNVHDCVVIGDSNVDVQTALNAGIPSIRVPSKLEEEQKIKATYDAKNLVDAVKYFFKSRREL